MRPQCEWLEYSAVKPARAGSIDILEATIRLCRQPQRLDGRAILLVGQHASIGDAEELAPIALQLDPILRREGLAYFLQDADEVVVDWSPSMNGPRRRTMVRPSCSRS